jgi:Transglutaminase-like superfamily
MRGKRSIVILVVTAAVIGAIAKQNLNQSAHVLVQGTVTSSIERHPSTENYRNSLAAGFGTLTLHGAMRSSATFVMTGAMSVGSVQNLNWSLPLQKSMRDSGFGLKTSGLRYSFDVSPDSHQDMIENGIPVRRFHWNNPPANRVIHVVERFHVKVKSDLSPFVVRSAYPLKSIPASVQPFLVVTPRLRLPASALAWTHRRFGRHATERAVVVAVADWVASRIHYDASRTNDPYVTAAWVYRNHAATCSGFDNIMSGILRDLGIPSRTVNGWVTSPILNLPGPAGGRSFIQWAVPNTAGELHTWLEIYFRHIGWVSFDPQREKFFVDPRHFAFYVTVDAGSQEVSHFSGNVPSGTTSLFGARLPQGESVIVPGDGIFSTVTVRSRDTMNVTNRGFKHDVSNVVLFSR